MTSESAAASVVVDNRASSQFEISVDGRVAYLAYRRDGDRLILVHTDVPRQLEGHGIGGRLVTAAIDEAADQHLTVVPLCEFAKGWLEGHPAIAARAPIEWPSNA
jgi:predicted GNAT family acetyltransferase